MRATYPYCLMTTHLQCYLPTADPKTDSNFMVILPDSADKKAPVVADAGVKSSDRISGESEVGKGMARGILPHDRIVWQPGQLASRTRRWL